MILKTLLIDGDYNWADQFATQAFSSDKLTVIGIEQEYRGAVGRLNEQNPMLVIVDQTAQSGEGLKLLERLAKEYPEVLFVFTTTARGDLLVWRGAMSKGALNVVYKPYTINNILDSVSQHLADSQKLDIERPVLHTGASAPAPESRVVKTQAGTTGVIKQDIITVYSPKGGVGKTTIACNVAGALASNKVLPIKVCLVDLDTSFGTVSSLLGLNKAVKYSVIDWDGYSVEEFDRRLVDQLVLKHGTGFDIVPAPLKPEEAALINRSTEDGVRKGKELAEKILRVLRSYYDIIVVDVGPSLREDSTITALDASSKVLLLSAADVPTINNVLSCQRTFDLLGIDQSKIRVVLNRVTKNNGLYMRMLNDICPYIVVGKLPDDPNVQKLANESKLAVIDARTSPFSQSVLEIVNTLAPVYGTQKKAGFWASLFGKKKSKSAW
jgi:pilus assembly protein CpaE